MLNIVKAAAGAGVVWYVAEYHSVSLAIALVAFVFAVETQAIRDWVNKMSDKVYGLSGD